MVRRAARSTRRKQDGCSTKPEEAAQSEDITPDGDVLVWCSCGSIRCVLIRSAITKGERHRRSASTTSSPTRATWTCSGTKTTGNHSASAVIQRRQRCRKDDGAESSPVRGGTAAGVKVEIANRKLNPSIQSHDEKNPGTSARARPGKLNGSGRDIQMNRTYSNRLRLHQTRLLLVNRTVQPLVIHY
jgi:hypothetical protein